MRQAYPGVAVAFGLVVGQAQDGCLGTFDLG